MVQIEKDAAYSLCAQCQANDIVCPSHLRKGLFVVVAMDNIDHDPSSTTAPSSSHGTGISLTVSYFSTQNVPVPSSWGWMDDSQCGWLPIWKTIPEAAETCTELIKCGCKSTRGCIRCKCVRTGLHCTNMCTCQCGIQHIAVCVCITLTIMPILLWNCSIWFIIYGGKWYLLNLLRLAKY